MSKPVAKAGDHIVATDTHLVIPEAGGPLASRPERPQGAIWRGPAARRREAPSTDEGEASLELVEFGPLPPAALRKRPSPLSLAEDKRAPRPHLRRRSPGYERFQRSGGRHGEQATMQRSLHSKQAAAPC